MLTAPAPNPQASASAPVLEFKGSRLGMSLGAWRAAPFPGANANVSPICSTGSNARHSLVSKVDAASQSSGALVCTYDFGGPNGPSAPVPIGDGFYAHRVRYVFRDGRLSEISFSTSLNAFDDMVARIDAQVGPAKEITRDTVRVFDRILPSVRMRWSGPTGLVTLTDPTSGTGLLSMDYVAKPQTTPAPTTGRSSAHRAG